MGILVLFACSVSDCRCLMESLTRLNLACPGAAADILHFAGLTTRMATLTAREWHIQKGAGAEPADDD